MEFKGTKGEWEYESTMYSNRKAINSLYNKNKHTVIESYIDNVDESEANAQLIATAPELLKALQDLVRYCDEWDCHADLQFAEETINKALGI